ncbi:MAG: DNA repair protein RecO [Bacillota bacterium]
MALVQDRCICLRKVEYSETSQILSLFGRAYGLVRVIAKGAHRTTKAGASKFGGGLDLLDVGEAVFTDRLEKDLATLTEWHLQEGHLELRKSLRGLYLGFYAAELVHLLIQERDPHPTLFDRLERTLLELGTPRMEQAFVAFEMDLLREAGYLPELQLCVSCGRGVDGRGVLSFAASRGGIICRNCEGAFPERMAVDGRVLGVMQYVLKVSQNGDPIKRLPGLTRHQTDPINRLLAEHVEHTLGRRMRVSRYILG